MGASNFLVVLLLSVALSVAQGAVAPDFNVPRWHIHVANGLSSGDLFAHCYSGDTNIGDHLIPRGHDIQWSFKENIWGTTLFHCFLRKPNNASASLDVFWHESDGFWLKYRCTTAGTCFWTARDDGIYLKNITDNIDQLIIKWE